MHNDGFCNGCITKRCLYNLYSYIVIFFPPAFWLVKDEIFKKSNVFVIFWILLVFQWRESLYVLNPFCDAATAKSTVMWQEGNPGEVTIQSNEFIRVSSALSFLAWVHICLTLNWYGLATLAYPSVEEGVISSLKWFYLPSRAYRGGGSVPCGLRGEDGEAVQKGVGKENGPRYRRKRTKQRLES